MKTLTLLRHAKSSWDDNVARDFDRPLNAKGRRAAVTVGEHLAVTGARYDRVLASPALRVLQTIEGVEEGLGRALSALFEPRIYMASAATLIDVAQGVPDTVDTLLMVGHNPGLEDLALFLAADSDPLRTAVIEKYPTATMAVLGLPGGWRALAEGSARLLAFTRPRDLDAALGPDED